MLIYRFASHQQPMTQIMEEKVAPGRDDVSEPDSVTQNASDVFSWSVD